MQRNLGSHNPAIFLQLRGHFNVAWMPFAGIQQSGLGVGGIPHTFRDMQIEKLLVIKSKATFLRTRNPKILTLYAEI